VPGIRRALLTAAIAAATAAAPATAAGQSRRQVVIGAFDNVGGSAADREILSALERGIATFESVTLIRRATALRRLRQARRPQLSTCEGDLSCLVELGRAVGADWVIGVDVGGLGDVRLLHLKLVDVAAARPLRSATGELGERLDRRALVELLEPNRYRGTLSLDVSVEGARIDLDGRRIATAPTGPIELEVGTHALRVTHPEHRDFVRFVEVAYGETVPIAVDMVPLDVVSGELRRTGGRAPGERGPWYRRWYVVAGIGVAILAGSAAIWAATEGGIGFDRERLR
jgi:hypothetical protein